MSRVTELVSEASEVLRSSSLHPLMMSEAVTRRSIVIVTSDGVACSSFFLELALLEGNASREGLYRQSWSVLRMYLLSTATI